MEDLDLLKRIPKEHYTEYKGKPIKVEKLLQLFEKQHKKKKIK